MQMQHWTKSFVVDPMVMLPVVTVVAAVGVAALLAVCRVPMAAL